MEDLEDLEGGEAGRLGKGGMGKVGGVSAGVSAADNPLLSRVNAPREASGYNGDGTDTEASGSPLSGEPQVGCFPHLTSAACLSPTCSVQNLKSSSSINAQ